MDKVLHQALEKLNLTYHDGESAIKISNENISSLFFNIERTFCLSEDQKIMAIPLANDVESVLLILYAFFSGKKILALDPSESSEQRKYKLSLFKDSVLLDRKILNLNDSVPSKALKGFKLNVIDYNDIFLITFTSGSTGAPKAVLHNRNSLVKCALAFGEIFGREANQTFGSLMPLNYMAGIFNGLLVPLLNNCNIVIFREFNALIAVKFSQLIAECGITDVWLSPSMMTMVCRLDRTREVGVSRHFKKAFVCTGPTSEQQCLEFKTLYKVDPIVGYGLSETLFVSFTNPENLNYRNVGNALPGVYLSISGDGTLVISGDYVAVGYKNDLGITHFNSEFASSDRIKIEANGELVYMGRTDDIIVRSGINIDPIELENLVKSEYGIDNFCFCGVQDTVLGYRLAMVFEGIDQGLEKSFQKTISKKSDKIKIDMFLYDVKLPRTVTGKVKRAELQQMLRSDI